MRLGSTALATGRVERRLAAILAADVAGYSRLMGADEEGTLARLKALRRELADPKIKEHRGRIVKTTGDGLLLEFASVVDAVRCAVEVQREMAERNADVPPDRRIEFRMGINVGDIIKDGRDIHGDGVNLASRLEALAEPGGICVSRVVRDQVRDKLAFSFEDMGEQQVKNIARPVRVHRIVLGEGVGPSEPLTQTSTKPPLALPDKPSIAVLPFTNMSADPEQEFFADGIAEDVITALSRYPSLFVIARNSCFTYKGRAVDVRQVGRELGVRYVLEGSLRKSGNHIRVTAQLVEAETGKHVWAERYDRDLADIFAVQDEITEAVTIAVAPAIADAELHRAMRKPPDSLDAWAAYQRGLWHMGKATVLDCALAEKFFRHAVELDSNFADAYCGLAEAQIHAAIGFRGLADMLDSAEPLARRAVTLDGSSAAAHSCLSRALFSRGDHHGTLAEAERALALSPNLASAHWRRGAALIYSGRPQEGLRDLQTSLRLEPRGSDLPHRLTHSAAGRYFCRAYEESVEAAKRAIQLFPDFPLPYRYLAAALGQLGRAEEAKTALEAALALGPGSFHLHVRGRPPWFRPEDHAHMLEGLRKAGLED
jgi:adenylate cyclase